MFIVDRHVGEQVAIGGPCVLSVAKIGQVKVKLAFDVPDDVRVARMETVEREIGRKPTIADIRALKSKKGEQGSL